MKKSFMTRALATGLSLAMAFSLSAATNVTVASAASTPAMASKQFAVRVGGATKTYKASAATLKTYRITKATVGNSSKATVAVASSKKGIKVTPGTVTGSTVVKVTFKNSKTKKSTAKKFRCVVKAPVDESYKITSATATGVKTITVELNKAVANTASLSAVVKKGASTRDSKFTVDGSKIVIAMDTKLMAGTYTVTIEGLEATALTADVAVEKDETLTKFDISPNLTMKTKNASETAICYYSALNQYGEPMVADQPSVSTSFSSTVNITRVATATVKGKIEVDKIPTVLAIQGTKGTIVLVDKNNGINTSAEVTLSAAATAAEATVAGTYNTASSKMEDLRAGANLGNYYILLTVKDQYGDPVTVDDFDDVANISIAGGLTNVEPLDTTDMTRSLTSITVDGTEYIAIKLASKVAKAGTYTMTIVNKDRGLLSTGTYDVADSVVITSISISPKNGVYLDQDNEMEYSVIDKDGKEVTSYAVLKAGTEFDSGKGIAWERKSDGTAKLVYNPKVSITADSDTASTIDTIVVKANDATSSNFIVKTFTFTVNKARKIKSVQGLADGTSTSVALNKELKIAFDKIVYADQYSNKVTKDDTAIYTKNVTTAAIAKASTGCSIAIVKADDAFAECATLQGTNMVFKSSKAGTATVYLKYSDVGQDVTASKDTYDYKFTVTATDTGAVAATSLKIDSVNGGYAWNVTDGAAKLAPKDIKVVGLIGGTQTEIPSDQYVIKSIKNGSFTTAEINAGTKTKTATVTIQVTTWDANNNATETELSADYQVSVEEAKVFKLIGTTSTVPSAGTGAAAAVTASGLQECFTFNDQFNAHSDGVAATAIKAGIATDVTYEVNVVNGGTDDYRLSGNGTNGVSLVFNDTAVGNTYTVKVTATLNGTSKTVTLELTIN